MKTCYACGIDFNYNLYKINPKTEKPYTRCEPCRLARSIAEKKEYKKKKLENFKEFHISYDILHHFVCNTDLPYTQTYERDMKNITDMDSEEIGVAYHYDKHLTEFTWWPIKITESYGEFLMSGIKFPDIYRDVVIYSSVKYNIERVSLYFNTLEVNIPRDESDTYEIKYIIPLCILYSYHEQISLSPRSPDIEADFKWRGTG